MLNSILIIVITLECFALKKLRKIAYYNILFEYLFKYKFRNTNSTYCF